jgi:hypothetical protein
MPIDVDATAGGNVLIVGRDVETNAPHLLVRRRDDVVREDDVVYQSHFASCAHADEFRRRR